MHVARTQAHLSKPSLCVAVQDPVAEKIQLLPHLRDTQVTSPSTGITSPSTGITRVHTFTYCHSDALPVCTLKVLTFILLPFPQELILLFLERP